MSATNTRRAARKHKAEVTRVAWSPDAKRLASASGAVKVWEAGSGRELLALKHEGEVTLKHEGEVMSVAWSPDGKRLASGTYYGPVRVWEAESGGELLTLRHDGAWSVAWSPDGKRLASAGAAVKVWEAASGRELLALEHPGAVSVAWSPDGKRLASGGYTTVKVWEAESGGELLALEHEGEVMSVAWSPDGKRLASASNTSAYPFPARSTVPVKNTTVLWEARSGRELLTLKGHEASVMSVAWSPDGRRLASAGRDKIVQVYAINFELLMSLARSRVTRNLTLYECRRYLHVDEVPPIPFS